ncbi:hypothetical protein SY88_04965 [Clostridiales bacterium PH28_bin88]|nr:hypothetical protein SY88_04965 [Clostridiales bacterium PH28_bin88]
MAKLLVLSLAETTRHFDTGYEVIARNLDDNSWVIIPSLPKNLLIINGRAAWDIFGTTEADIKVNISANRSGVYEVDTKNYYPNMIQPPIKENSERDGVLYGISSESVQELSSSPEWVGLLREPAIKDIIFEERYADAPGYNPQQTFYWECRLEFNDKHGNQWRYNKGPGVACKDMRFKAYWLDIVTHRKEQFRECKEKWINYMQTNTTYLLIEFIPNPYYSHISMVSGILCIKNESAGVF